MRPRAESVSLALLSRPQAAKMSRPRGVRNADASPALNTISENFSIWSQSDVATPRGAPCKQDKLRMLRFAHRLWKQRSSIYFKEIKG